MVGVRVRIRDKRGRDAMVRQPRVGNVELQIGRGISYGNRMRVCKDGVHQIPVSKVSNIRQDLSPSSPSSLAECGRRVSLASWVPSEADPFSPTGKCEDVDTKVLRPPKPYSPPHF